MKFLVLGGAGFLGTNMVRALVQRFPENEVVALDSLDPEIGSSIEGLKDIMSKISFIQADIRDQSILDKVLPGVDVVLNCAAQTSHPRSIRNPLLDTDINCLGNLRLLETIKVKCPQAVVIFPSSSTVIGRIQRDVIDESHPERPLEIYSANKGVAEKYYEIYHSVHGLKTIVLRFANLYGPFGKKTPDFGFLNYFIHLAWNRQPIKIYGTGFQTRNVMHVDDAVDIMLLAATRPELYGKMFFATSPYHHSLREVAESIVKVFGRGSLETVEWPEERLKIEVGAVQFTAKGLQWETGWKSKVTLLEGLERTRAELEKQEKAL